MFKFALLTETAEPDMLDNVFNNANRLVEFGADLLTVIIEHPVLSIFVAASFIGIGLGIVRRLKRTAR